MTIESKQALIKANEDYNKSNEKQIANLKTLNEQQIQQFINTTKIEKASLKDRQEALDKFQKYLNNLKQTAQPVEWGKSLFGGGINKSNKPEQFIGNILKDFDPNFIIKQINDLWKSPYYHVDFSFFVKNLFKSMGERSEERRVVKECRSRWSPYH